MEASVIADVERIKGLLSLDPNEHSSRSPIIVDRIEEDHGRTAAMVCGFDPQKSRVAMDQDCTKIIQLLHNAGANMSRRDNNGWTLLSLYAVRGYTNVCSYLIEQTNSTDPAMINEADNFNRTAIMKAAAHGHLDVLNLLLNHGANLMIKDKDGLTALHFATVLALQSSTYFGFWKNVIHAVPLDKLNSASDNHERNIMMYAAIANRRDMLEELLSIGANVTSKDIFGVTVTQMSSDDSIRKMLIDEYLKQIEIEHSLWLEQSSANY